MAHFYRKVRVNRNGDIPLGKILAIVFVSVLFLTAIILAIVHIVRQQSLNKTKKESMEDTKLPAVLKYFKIMDGIRLKWAHRVNSQKTLNEALKDSSVHMLEADVIMDPVSRVPIMAHPPENSSDITLFNWLTLVLKNPGKGVKLDFKQLQAVEPSMKLLDVFVNKTQNMPPVFLNADIMVGPNQPSATPLNGKEFIRICKQYYQKATLSLGWTTRFINGKNDGYSWDMVKNMNTLMSNVTQPVTFPVRASLAFQSKDQLLWLLKQRDDYTITIWTSKDDNYDVIELKFLRKFQTRVFYDLPDSEIHQLLEP